MKLFLLTQTVNRDYDTFDGVVVAAPDAASAKEIHPQQFPDAWTRQYVYKTWADNPNQVTAEYLGEARPGMPSGIVLSSFNAG